MNLNLYSEPFSKNGNLAGEGFKRLLGRPNLDLLQTLVRESLQNVIDATLPGFAPQARIRLRRLGMEERAALTGVVLATLPQGLASREALQNSTETEELWVLEIADFGTVGLSGPTEADVPPAPDERANFVNFLKNVGAARDSHQGGGTYGYGKSSLYGMSTCSLVLVDSQTFELGRPVRRFMACHLGDAFDVDSSTPGPRRFTGRHWWGMSGEGDSIAPATDENAIALSKSLGIFPRAETDSGTSIVILDPELDFSSLEKLGPELVTCVLLNFWPRMAQTTNADRRLHVSIEIDGETIEMPSPEAFPPLDLFCRALADVRTGSANLHKIKSQRPAKGLGRLAFAPGISAPRHPLCAPGGSDVLVNSSHIAVMRPVELVVKYIRGSAYPDPTLEWAGVFVCSKDPEVEEAFAQAEPPTHDDWVPNNLPKGRQQTMVRVGMRDLRIHADNFVPVRSLERSADAGGPSLAATSGQMGKFLGPVSSRGAGKPTAPGRIAASLKKGVRVTALEMIGLSIAADGSRVANFRADLFNDGSKGPISVLIEPKLVVDGGGIDAVGVPDHLIPTVQCVALPSHGLMTADNTLAVGLLEGQITASIRLVEGAAITAGARILEGVES